MRWPWSGRNRIGAPRPASAASRARSTATMSTSPARWSDSWKDRGSASRRVARRCAKPMRSAKRSAIAGRSLSARTPSDPVQKHRPLARDGTASNSAAKSSPVDATRGRPKSGRGGSSGWRVSVTPRASAAGVTESRNSIRCRRRRFASMSRYWPSLSRKPSTVIGSVVEPGSADAIVRVSSATPSSGIASKMARARSRSTSEYSASAPGRRRMCRSKAAKRSWSKRIAVAPVGSTWSMSVRVQSTTGMKL